MSRAAFVYDPVMSAHVLRQDHVFRPSRLQLTFELLESYGAFRHESSLLTHPRLATDSELLSFHTPDYLEVVKALSQGRQDVDAARYNFSESGDNPPYPGMFEASALAVGASLVAADMLTSGEAEIAFNISGGLHHAAPAMASGFCVFNDAVIAIKRMLDLSLRVAYVDIDAHHGDGVQDAFYADSRVLTISLHESGRYLFPGAGEATDIGEGEGKGYAVNLPLAPGTDDDVYLKVFRELVHPLVAAFHPDVLVSQLGVDTHYQDPLTHLQLTTGGYMRVLEVIKGLSPGRWLALGGGGYDMSAVARNWTLAYGVMLGEEWPDEVPMKFRERYGIDKLRDHEGPPLDLRAKERASRFAAEGLQTVKKLVFPIHGLR